ncbi:Hypothetical predicted protein [Paramuricea clavata]|uniref:Ubiquitin-like-conjugating enzyme ATG10 n=1 Tax=Paramuricea clavata TaxID=317549 RepID=A0A7D9HC77_PARCT|nr:Hypothetical predicted protein [Paramuricea clavata]
MSDGSLTREQFNNAIDKFVEKCQILNENWCVRHVENAPDQIYLAKRQTIATTVENTCKTEFENLADDTEEYLKENTFDSSVYSSNTDQLKKILTFEYHVVYSPSYSVPVLYFSAWTQDGKLLSLEDIWKQVPEIHHDFLNYDKWSFITQQVCWGLPPSIAQNKSQQNTV